MANSQRQRVLLGMSGGVDSSVAALLLRDAGYEVTGVTLKLLDASDAAANQEQDVESARRVCERLGIEHIEHDYRDEFSACVINRFCEEYACGLTPNPCIECNRSIKFRALESLMEPFHASYVATGHYAQCAVNGKTGRFELRRASDSAKDQSYFLGFLGQSTLSHTLFPLGSLAKTEVRRIASEHGFENAQRAESQDICFITSEGYATFIQRRTGTSFEPGPIVTRAGTVVGRHAGLVHYTAGQRKGIGVAYSEPLYVFAKNAERNELVVDTDANTRCADVFVSAVNYVALPSLNAPRRVEVKTHYRQTPVAATIEPAADGAVRIVFDETQRACAPGQTAVAYEGDVVVCAGIIR